MERINAASVLREYSFVEISTFYGARKRFSLSAHKGAREPGHETALRRAVRRHRMQRFVLVNFSFRYQPSILHVADAPPMIFLYLYHVLSDFSLERFHGKNNG